MTGVLQYAVVRFVPDVVRDERINVGVIVRDSNNHEFAHRFLPRGAALRKLAPAADRRLVANFEHELSKLQNRGQLFPMGTLSLVGHPTDPEFFDRAREEYN